MIARRLRPRSWENQPQPMLAAANIHYEMSQNCRAMSCGGIGAIHTMVQKLGLIGQLDDGLQLLKRHLPYHQSDHVLNICYNAMRMPVDDLLSNWPRIRFEAGRTW